MKANSEIKKGDELFAEGKYEEAITHYSLSLENMPDNEIAYIKKGDAYLALKEWQKAKSEFAKAIEIVPDSFTVYDRYADTLIPVTLNGLIVDKNRARRDSSGALKSLTLNGLGISNPAYLSGIEVYAPSLEVLMLNNNEFEKIDLTPLEGFDNLKTLLLNSNKLTEIVLAPLKSSSMLQILNLEENQIASIDLTPLAGIDSLQTLNLRHNKLESIDLQAIGNMKNLKQLELQYNDFSKEKCSEITDYVVNTKGLEDFTDPCKKPPKSNSNDLLLNFVALGLAFDYGNGYGEWEDTWVPIAVDLKKELITVSSKVVQKFQVLRTVELDNGVKMYTRDQDGKYPDIRMIPKDDVIHIYIDYSNIGYVYECISL